MKKLFIVIFLCILIFIPYAYSVAPTLLVDAYSAKSLGMNNAVSAVPSDPITAIYANPALMSYNTLPSVSLGYISWLADSSFYNGAFSFSCKQAGVFSFGFNLFSIKPFEELSFDSGLSGELKEAESSVFAGFSRQFQFSKKISLSGGLITRYIRSRLGDSTAGAISFDLGVFSGKIFSSEKTSLNVAMVLQNLGTGLKYSSEASVLPINRKLGISLNYRVNEDADLVADVDFNFPNDGDFSLSLGGEYNRSDLYFLRAGLQPFGKKNNTFKLGFGLHLPALIKGFDIMLDYSLVPLGVFGLNHALCMSGKFSGL